MQKLFQLLKKNFLYILLLIYVLINLYTLEIFPFVHSDEAWLSGLSRNIWEQKDFSATEAFFDLKIRNPHAIKILFHSLQIVFMNILGYDIFTFRFISLIFGLLSLFILYKITLFILGSRSIALFAAAFLAVDVQFVYASHFARQEILLLFIMLVNLMFMLRKKGSSRLKDDIIIGSIIGISIGIHPNSFIISLPFGLIYLLSIIKRQDYRFKNLGVYIITISSFAAFFIMLSFSFDPDFIHNYLSYGSEFDILNPISSKIAQVKDFYLKLYYGVSGTYYTPNIKLQFILFPISFIVSFLLIFKDDDIVHRTNISYIILSIIAVNAGIILIGRYNQTSIVFIFPLFYILLAYLLQKMPVFYRKLGITVILVLSIINTVQNYLPYRDNSYEYYLKNIAKAVSPKDNVIANLNCDYYFQNGKLHDYRNLTFMKSNNISFGDYIKKNNISYIIYTEELDLIKELSPKWDGIYGEMNYYDDMKKYIQSHCKNVYEFYSPAYGIRIVRYMNTKDWYVKIYKVLY